MTDPDYYEIEDALQNELDQVAQEIEHLREQGTLPDNPTADQVANELLMDAYIDGLEARINSLQSKIDSIEDEVEEQ